MKEFIKQLAAEQKALKLARKTGTIPELPRVYGYYVNWSEVPTPLRVKIKDSWKAARLVEDNKPIITAALHVYHKLRGTGKGMAHRIPNDWGYMRTYQKAYNEFSKKFLTPTDDAVY